jgi:regulator of replication initiation timing
VNLNSRLAILEKMIAELTAHIKRTIDMNVKLEQEKKEFEKRFVEYQEKLTS